MHKRSLLILFLLGMLLLLSIWPARAQTGGAYKLTWLTIDGGGVTLGSGAASGGAYALQNTLGQPDPGISSGGAYTLRGGFWVKSYYRHYLPITVR
jgi:hypothetical protein